MEPVTSTVVCYVRHTVLQIRKQWIPKREDCNSKLTLPGGNVVRIAHHGSCAQLASLSVLRAVSSGQRAT